MDSRRLISPQLLNAIDHFFPQRCTIQDRVSVRDDHGQPRAHWVSIPQLSDIPCRIAPSGGQEIKRPDQTYVVSTHNIALKGRYTGITEEMRAVIDGQAYDILLVQNDSQNVITWLKVEIVR